MCQLLGMNSNKPASLHFSLAGFFRRGGETDEHADGWGVAFHEDDCCSLWIDDQPAAYSPVAQRVREEAIRSRNAIAHIRKATRGRVAQVNCHPFRRVLWDKEWSFAHNGTVDLAGLPAPRNFVPVGQTDSEHAFCLILDALVEQFGAAEPDMQGLVACVEAVANVIAKHGTFNFMLSNGEVLLARRATELHYVQRSYPFGRARLLDSPLEIDFSRHNHLDDRMVIIATRPLTDEPWMPIPVGEVVAFVSGERRELARQAAVGLTI